jgi:sigma-E factor negative regulatory protein RseA
MSETAYESLSALMDNEAEDLEIRRLLRQYADQPELQEKWARYQLVSAVLGGDASTETGVNLSRQIAQQIEEEPCYEVVGGRRTLKTGRSNFLRPMGSVAIAASVTFLVVFGAQRLSVSGTDVIPQASFANQSELSSFQVEQGVLKNSGTATYKNSYGGAQLASTGTKADNLSAANDQRADVRSATVKPVRDIDLYLQQHARNSALSGVGGTAFAKTAAFKVEQ